MWYLYLDESGDLGFDYVNKRPSKFFTILILAIKREYNRQLINSVKHTLKRKLNRKRNKKRTIQELKATSTTLGIKKYFFKQVERLPFALFCLTLNKRKVYERLTREKERVYNYVARLVLDQIRFENADQQVELIVDRSKSQKQIREFNEYIINQLKARINPKVPLNINHENSIVYKGLQAADLFSWGVFRKYEKQKCDWFDVFKGKVKLDEQFL